MWAFNTRKLVVRFLEKKLFPVETVPSQGLHMELEDYLFGLLNLASELARFAVNSVVAGDNDSPFKVKFFKVQSFSRETVRVNFGFS